MDNRTHRKERSGQAVNAWGEPLEPNPVLEIITVRTLQVGITGSILLMLLAAFLPILPVAVLGGVGVTIGLSAYFVRTFLPRTTYPGCSLMTHLSADRGNAVAFTFDDGPHPDTTPRLLDTLAKTGATATFFLVGERASQFPELVRRIHEEGHRIGIHGLRHRAMVLQSASEIERDLTEAVARIEEAAGVPLPRPLLLRPPHGFQTWTLARTVQRMGFQTVAWSLDPRDYDLNDSNGTAFQEAVLVETVTNRLQPGAILLLHERPEIPAAVLALPRLIAVCRERGLTLVEV